MVVSSIVYRMLVFIINSCLYFFCSRTFAYPPNLTKNFFLVIGYRVVVLHKWLLMTLNDMSMCQHSCLLPKHIELIREMPTSEVAKRKGRKNHA